MITEQEVYLVLDTLRGKRKLAFTPNIVAVVSKYINSKDDLLKLVNESDFLVTDSILDFPIVKDYIIDFVTDLISNLKFKKVLDPWANFGQFINVAHKINQEAEIISYVPNQALATFNLIAHQTQVIKGNLIQDGLLGEDFFDLILSNLPVGLSGPESRYGIGRNEANYQLIGDCATKLSDGGHGVFTISKSLFSSRNGEALLRLFKEEKIAVRALLSTPINSLNERSAVPFQLLVIKKGDIQSEVFLGRIEDDNNHNKLLFQNFIQNKKGKSMSQGLLKPIEEVNVIEFFEKEKELNISLRKTGLPLVKLEEVVNVRRFQSDEPNENWILIRRPMPVTFSFNSNNERIEKLREELKTGENRLSQRYIPLELKPKIVNKDYLINLLNSPLGKKILEFHSTGVVQPIIQRSSLSNLLLPLPDKLKQDKIVELSNSILFNREKLSHIHKELWKAPSKFTETDKVLKSLIKDPDSLDWLEELPFPIASILWGYYSESKPQKKVEYLFLFFEGLCQFIDVLLLSAISSDKVFFNAIGKTWLKNEKIKKWHEKSSFGGWIWLYETLAKKIRGFNSEDFNINEILGNPSKSYFEGITSKKLIPVFNNVRNLRNSFKGHNGVVSNNAYKEVLVKLETQLDVVKPIIVDTFSDVNLIRVVPSTMDFDEENEIYKTTSNLIKGTRSLFNKEDILTNRPLSSKQLYILHDDAYRAIKVLPLIQMRASPKSEQNAVYFYNRIDGESVRMVSYHFEKESEFNDNLDSFENALNILNPE